MIRFICVVQILLWSSFSASANAESSTPDIKILFQAFEEAGWTLQLDGMVQQDRGFSIESLTAFSSDYSISIVLNTLDVTSVRDTATELEVDNISFKDLFIGITDLPDAYGPDQEQMDLNISMTNAKFDGVLLSKVALPGFLSLAQRLPAGLADDTPANQRRAFYDGITLYTFRGLEIDRGSIARFEYQHGTGQARREDSLEDVIFDYLTQNGIARLMANNWVSENDLLPRWIQRGEVDLRNLTFRQ